MLSGTVGINTPTKEAKTVTLTAVKHLQTCHGLLIIKLLLNFSEGMQPLPEGVPRPQKPPVNPPLVFPAFFKIFY